MYMKENNSGWKMYMKENNSGWNMIKRVYSREIIVCAGQGLLSFVISVHVCC